MRTQLGNDIACSVLIALFAMRVNPVTHRHTVNMNHKYLPGQNVNFHPRFGNNAARGKYKIICQLPIEGDERLSYRIKSTAESFERVVQGHQLTYADQ